MRQTVQILIASEKRTKTNYRSISDIFILVCVIVQNSEISVAKDDGNGRFLCLMIKMIMRKAMMVV